MSARSFRSYQWGGWSVMAAAFFMVFIHRFSVAAVADNLCASPPEGLGLTGAALGNLASIYFYVYALMQIPTGLLADSVGPRYSATFGMAVAAAGAITAAVSPSLALVAVARGLTGMGTAMVYVSTLRFQAEWFSSRQFSTITGLTSVAGNLGGMFAATPLALTVLWVGWRGAFGILGVATFLVSLVILIMVRNSPADAGIDGAEHRPGVTAAELKDALKAVVSNRITWQYFLVYLGGAAGTLSFNGLWGIPYLMQVYGLPKSTASTYAIFMPLGIAIGSPLWGWLSDRLGRRKPFMVGGLLSQVILWVIFLCPWGGRLPLWLIPVVLFAIGMSAIVFVLSFAGTKEANNPRYSGTAISVVNGGGFVGGAIMNALIGTMLDARWAGQLVNGARVYSLQAFHRAFALYVAFSAMAFLSAVLLPGEGARRKAGKRRNVKCGPPDGIAPAVQE